LGGFSWMNRAAVLSEEVALTVGGPAKPKQFAESNHITGFESFGSKSEEGGSADKVLFAEVNVATDTTTLRAAGLTGKAHALPL
jgi:hypothetical protein